VKKPEYLVRCTEIDSQRGICDRDRKVSGSFSGRHAEKTFSRTAEETPSHAWSSSSYGEKAAVLMNSSFFLTPFTKYRKSITFVSKSKEA